MTPDGRTPRRKESATRTLLVAATVCLTCSVFVSTSAVLLEPRQEANRERERQRHLTDILAGHPALAEIFASLDAPDVRERIVELHSGSYADWISPAEFDPRAAERDPLQSVELPAERDLAGIQRRAKLAKVYEVTRDGRIVLLILPVHGAGFVSTLYGYLALEADGNTVVGLSFYEHSETPGLGAAIDDESWLAQWRGKQVRDPSGEIRIGVAADVVDPTSPRATYLVDGLSGATLTSDGVTNLVRFWVGPDGFGPYLERLRP